MLRKSLSLFVAIAVIVCLSACNSIPTVEKGITFRDGKLEAAIRKAIGNPEGPITTSELEELTYLSHSGKRSVDPESGKEYWVNQITDLAGLERCTNLTTLFLSWNEIDEGGHSLH